MLKLINLFRREHLVKNVKNKFQSYKNKNCLNDALLELERLTNKYPKNEIVYKQIFFNIYKDFLYREVLLIGEDVFFNTKNTSFLKVLATRYERIGDYKRVKELYETIGLKKNYTFTQSKISKILRDIKDKKLFDKQVENLYSAMSRESYLIYKYVFIVFKDEDLEKAIDYGFKYLNYKPIDKEFLIIFNKRLKLYRPEDLFFNDIKYIFKLKNSLNLSHNYFDEKKFSKDLYIIFNKLKYKFLIKIYIEESFNKYKNNEVYKIAFYLFKDMNIYDSIIEYGNKYKNQFSFNQLMYDKLENVINIEEEEFKVLKDDFDKELQKISDIHFNQEVHELLLNIAFKRNEVLLKYMIEQLILKFPNKKMKIYRDIFSIFKDLYRDIAIKYGLLYYEVHKEDCNFIRVLIKRLEWVDNNDKILYIVEESVKYCKKDLYHLRFKYRLKNSLLELEELYTQEKFEQVYENINILEEKFKGEEALLYRELFKFYQNKDFKSAEKFALKSLDLINEESFIKSIYDFYIVNGFLYKAKNILPTNPNLNTLKIKLDNINSLLSLYEKGFIYKVEKVKAYSPIYKKVVYLLHNRLPYNSGGYATRSHGLLSGAFESGWQMVGVSRLGYPSDKLRYIDVNEFDRIENIIYYPLLKDEIKLGAIPLKEYLVEYTNSLLEFVLREKPSIIHAASNYMNGIVANNVAKALGIPSIYEVRGLWELTRISRQPEWENTEYYNLMAKMEAEAAQGADIVFTLTNALKDEMIRRGVDADKIYILPNGVVTERFLPLAKNQNLAKELNINNKTVVGFIGSFVQYEGLEYIVDAIEILVNRGKKDIIVLMVGDGAVWQDIVDRVEKKGLQAYFIFTGRIPHEEVEEYYSLVDIAPLPRKGLPVCEMVSPLKPFEAMAMEKVVLSSDVAALAEIVQDGYNGMLFEKDNVQDLADKIELLANDLELRTKLGKQAREWVLKERDWKVISKRLVNIYQDLENSFI